MRFRRDALHNGPLLTNNEFHNTGVPAGTAPEPDRGRMAGARSVLDDEFNCRSKWSDAKPGQCSELDFLVTDSHELERAFKVPSLRNVAGRAPYMHAGQLATLEDKPLQMSADEVRQLTAFLRTLSGGTAPPELLRAP